MFSLQGNDKSTSPFVKLVGRLVLISFAFFVILSLLQATDNQLPEPLQIVYQWFLNVSEHLYVGVFFFPLLMILVFKLIFDGMNWRKLSEVYTDYSEDNPDMYFFTGSVNGANQTNLMKIALTERGLYLRTIGPLRKFYKDIYIPKNRIECLMASDSGKFEKFVNGPKHTFYFIRKESEPELEIKIDPRMMQSDLKEMLESFL